MGGHSSQGVSLSRMTLRFSDEALESPPKIITSFAETRLYFVQFKCVNAIPPPFFFVIFVFSYR